MEIDTGGGEITLKPSFNPVYCGNDNGTGF